MASVFGHAIIAVVLGRSFPSIVKSWKFWLLGVLCTILPDADVINFKFGIPYEAFWGHRGFSHSILFAIIIGFLIVFFFYCKKLFTREGLFLFIFFALCTASHGILDGMTSGGLGVAFFSPFDNSRYFFPWRPIKVSPIGIGNFFSPWGMRVIISELKWMLIPSLIYLLVYRVLKLIK